jgi:hypothetical protein
MKLTKKLLAGSLMLGGFIALSILLHAQEAEMPSIQVEPLSLTPSDLKSFPSLSEAQAAALASELDATPTISADEQPRSGTFWSLANPKWPPLPGNLYGFPVWLMDSGNAYLLDDVDFDYTTPAIMQRGMQAMSFSGPPGFDEGGTNGMGTNQYFYSSFTVIDYGTNLWIAQVQVTNSFLAGIGTNTEADVPYEIQSRTNLLQSDWQSEGFIFGSELTNWTPLSVAQNGRTNLFIRLRSWADDGSGLPLWWQQQYFGTNGVDPYGNPAGDGWNNLQKFQASWNPNTFYTPPAPQNLKLQVDGTGTNVTLTWQSGGGNVSQYKVEKFGYWETHTSSYVSAPQTSFALSLDQAYFGSQFFTPAFQVTALFSNSFASAPATAYLSSEVQLPIQIIHNAQGQFELLASGLPSETTAIHLFWETDHDFGIDNAYYEVPVSNFVNGVFILPDSVMAGYPVDYPTAIQALLQSGQFGWGHWYGVRVDDIVYPNLVATNDWQTWINASARVLKDNLIFLLRSATVNHSFSYESSYAPPPGGYGGEIMQRAETGAAYEYSSYRYPGYFGDELKIEKYTPVAENYLWRNYADFDGSFVAGARYNYNTGKRTFYQPDSVIQSSDLPPNAIPSSLLANDTASYYFYRFSADPAYEPQAHSEAGLVISGTNVFLPAGVRNIYGLPVLSVMGDDSVELTAGGAASPLDDFDNTLYWYVQTAMPSLTTVGYYFASETPYDAFGSPPATAPGTSDFSPTNAASLLITGIGQNFNVMGWAKEAIVNGYTGKFAYLEQFFDKAYQVNTNGVVTTNSAGPLSSYGDFFATQPGQAALMTMPDLDTGERGTCTVYCVSLQLDKNHDGNMDLAFNGTDATSQANPMTIWVNNGHTEHGHNGNLDFDLPTTFASTNYLAGKITCQRDLENFFRLWICGVPALPLSQNYTFTMSMSPISGNPAVNLYWSCETNGGIGYLTDTNIAAQQAFTDSAGDFGMSIGTVSNNCSCDLAEIAFAFGGTQHLLFEGAGIGLGQLTLTISQNSNVVAQTSVWLDLHDIKDFYEQAHATNVTSGLPPSSLISQCKIDHTTTKADGETGQVIIFVHGINNTQFNYYDSTETIFKRLYWSGYHGKVAGFRWPCAYLPFENTLNPFNYNIGEFYAWKSASALRVYLNYLRNRSDLTNYTINILAHSQGNVVASEAVKQGGAFDNYILTQGAIPAQCYDTGTPFQQKFLDKEASLPTPLYATNGGYHGYFTNLTGNLINFYNTNDYALAVGTFAGHQANWEENQISQKPESFVFAQQYGYAPSTGISSSYYGGVIPPVPVTDPYEIMSMVARSRTHAVGAQGGMGGAIKSTASNNLFAKYTFGNTRDEHSAQFSRNIQRAWSYYDDVLLSFGINPIIR